MWEIIIYPSAINYAVFICHKVHFGGNNNYASRLHLFYSNFRNKADRTVRKSKKVFSLRVPAILSTPLHVLARNPRES